MTEPATITLELTPYNVISEGIKLTVQDCHHSALNNLNNAFAVTGDRFSEDADRAIMETQDGALREYRIEYHSGEDGDCCSFTSVDGEAANLDEVAQWIYENYDRMKKIAHETLLDDKEVEEVFRRHKEIISHRP